MIIYRKVTVTVTDQTVDSGSTVMSRYLGKNVELGMRQHCRENMTKFSDHKVVGYCIISTCKFVPEALLRCREA